MDYTHNYSGRRICSEGQDRFVRGNLRVGEGRVVEDEEKEEREDNKRLAGGESPGVSAWELLIPGGV